MINTGTALVYCKACEIRILELFKITFNNYYNKIHYCSYISIRMPQSCHMDFSRDSLRITWESQRHEVCDKMNMTRFGHYSHIVTLKTPQGCQFDSHCSHKESFESYGMTKWRCHFYVIIVAVNICKCWDATVMLHWFHTGVTKSHLVVMTSCSVTWQSWRDEESFHNVPKWITSALGHPRGCDSLWRLRRYSHSDCMCYWSGCWGSSYT